MYFVSTLESLLLAVNDLKFMPQYITMNIIGHPCGSSGSRSSFVSILSILASPHVLGYRKMKKEHSVEAEGNQEKCQIL